MQYYADDEGQALRDSFESEVLHWPYVSVRRMFGCPAYMADGKLFAFLTNQGIVITQMRLRDREILSGSFTLEPFTINEREIQQWILVTVEDPTRLNRVLPFVRKSYQTVLNQV